jgi:hypothetical protein
VIRFAELHPADDTEVVEGLGKVVDQLVAQSGAAAA